MEGRRRCGRVFGSLTCLLCLVCLACETKKSSQDGPNAQAGPEVLKRAAELCERTAAARGQSPWQPDLRTDPASVLPVVRSIRSDNRDWQVSPTLLGAKGLPAADRVQTVACIDERREDAGYYVPESLVGGPGPISASAYRLLWDACLVGWSSEKVIACRPFRGGPPPPESYASGASYGAPPVEDFHDWLAGTQQSLHHSTRVRAVQFSRDGSVLASAGDLVLLWNMTTNGVSGGANRFGSPREGEPDVTSASISPSLDLAAFGNSEAQVRLWSIPREEWLDTLKAYPYATRVVSLAISGDSRLVAAGFIGCVKLWDASSRLELRELRGLDGAVAALSFSRDGRMLATGDADGNVRLWSIQEGAQIWRRRARRPWLPFKTEVNVVAFSADGRSIAAGTEDPAIIVLWDTATGRTIDVLGAPSPVMSLAFAPDGRTLAAGMRSGAITIWDVAKGKERRTLTGHTHAVITLAFAPNGRTLASGSADETARPWVLPEN